MWSRFRFLAQNGYFSQLIWGEQKLNYFEEKKQQNCWPYKYLHKTWFLAIAHTLISYFVQIFIRWILRSQLKFSFCTIIYFNFIILQEQKISKDTLVTRGLKLSVESNDCCRRLEIQSCLLAHLLYVLTITHLCTAYLCHPFCIT